MYLTVLAQGNDQVRFFYGAGDVFAKCIMDGTQILHSQRKYPGIPTNKTHAQSKTWTGGLLQQYSSPMQCQYPSVALMAKNANNLLRSF